MNLKNKKVAVLGFGLEGKDLVGYLINKGAKVYIHDIKTKKQLDTKGFEKYVLKYKCGKNYLQNLSDYDIIFRSPGVYRYKKEIVTAEERGVIISSATKIFFNECKGKIIGITGTKGKGTTATLIYRSIINDKQKAYLLGNIGEPFLEKLHDIDGQTWVVMELSSFQLIDLTKSPHIAVILNIIEDHLDWHKNVKEYVKSKKNILKYQDNHDYAAINHDYKISRSFSTLGKGEKYYFSIMGKVRGCFIDDERIIINLNGNNMELGNTNDLILKGRHIWENVTASVCASLLAGVKKSSIKKAIYNFKGYEHRMEFVRKVDGIIYYNDSAATGPHSAMAAVGSFDKPITLILGGYDKGLSYTDFVKELGGRSNLRNVILIGDIAKKLEKLFNNSEFKGQVLNMEHVSIKNIVNKAKAITQNGGIILLSPATSSFDMFNSYKDRGDKFKAVINKF